VALSRPGKDEGPTKIYVAMGLLDVDEIDTANQNFTANLFITARWYDPRLAHPGPGRRVVPLDEIWNPQLVFVNQQKIWPTLPRVAHISPDGEVEFRQRVWGPFSQPLDIRDCLLDRSQGIRRPDRSGDHIDADPDRLSFHGGRGAAARPLSYQDRPFYTWLYLHHLRRPDPGRGNRDTGQEG
ncbi:MAG TPA: hypothetical protein ENH12_06075, partial [Proteobacteria bacterium]|nr:hypothetical protein [Pseudomonadota bacterium]